MLVGGFLLAAWWAASASISPIILPSPPSVGRALWQLLVGSTLAVDAVATAARVACALIAGLLIGVPAGLGFGYSPRTYSYVDAPLHALRSVPATALFPLLLMVVGVGEPAMLLLAAYPSVLLIMVNAVAGARLANRHRLEQARIFELSAFTTIRDVVAYEALPSIFQGVRTAVSYSLALVVVVEMFIGVSHRGLGRLIYEYQSSYRIPETYAAILVTALGGVGLNALVSAGERRMLHWLPARSADAA